MEPTTALAIQDLVSCCVGSKRSLGNPVHKVRKSYRPIVSVIWLYEKKAFMNSVIADDSTGIAQPFNVRAQIERQDLIPQVSPCAAEMNDKTLGGKKEFQFFKVQAEIPACAAFDDPEEARNVIAGMIEILDNPEESRKRIYSEMDRKIQRQIDRIKGE